MFQMLSKREHPTFNRQFRRHPKPVSTALGKGFHFGANWLLAAIMLKAGYITIIKPEAPNGEAQSA